MNTARIALAGVLAALFTILGANAAHAYPDRTCNISVDDQRFVGGLPLDYTATSGAEADFVVTFNGETETGSGTKTSGTFSTPKVGDITKKTITVQCLFGDQSTASDSATITLLPKGADTGTNTGNVNGALPDTGGSNLWILIVGGVLVVVGGGAVVASRRQS